ncbi:MAG: biotin transporter BioY [Alphaproteobacteria bacterium]
MTVRTATIADIVWPSRPQARAFRAVALMLLGVCLLTLSAKIQIPFWPVPMTMQTLVVLVIGMAYGWRLGAATVLAYLVAGAAGLPVFAGTPARGIGVAYMMGPTGGFLVGFLVSAAAVGFLGQRGWDRSVPRTAIAMVLGQAIITLAGVAWLAVLFNLPKAIEVGFKPFLAASLLKVALGIVLMPTIWKLLDRDPAKHAN